MATRNVIVASSLGKAKKINNFTGTTWGELKSHPDVKGLITDNLEAVVNPGKTTLRGDDSELPEVDFRVYLLPTKNKAGYTPDGVRRLAEEISDAIIAAADKATDNDLEDLKDNLISEIEDFFDVSLDEECEECEEAIREAQGL